jgi:hypothetical protein
MWAASVVAWGGAVQGADVEVFAMLKTQLYRQTNGTAPVALSSNGYHFSALILASTNSAITNATVTPPGRASQALAVDDQTGTWRYDFGTNTQGQVDALFPKTGEYGFEMRTAHDGVKTASLTWPNVFGIPLAFPSAVQVSNLEEAQGVDQTVDFKVRWSISGGTEVQMVQFAVLDVASNVVFNTPLPFTTGALNGKSSGAVIPAGVLPAGADLEGHLIIAQPGLPNTTDYPGATGVAALARDTSFALHTRARPQPPVLSVLPSTNAQFRLRLTGEAQRTYQIQATTDWGEWTNLLSTNSASGTFDCTDTETTNLARRFYRGQVGK